MRAAEHGDPSLGFHDVPCYIRLEVVGEGQVHVAICKGEPKEWYEAHELIYCSTESEGVMRDVMQAIYRTLD